MNILGQYYGRMPKRSLRWRQIEQLVREMFSQDYGGIKQRTLTFYGNDPVCVFKYFIKPNDPQRNFVLFLLVLNFGCFVLIAAAYGAIAAASRKSVRTLQKTGNCPDTKIIDNNSRLQRVTQAIIFTDFICWVPFIVVSFLHLSGAINATSWYSFITILVLPINCVVNPVLYDSSTTKYIHVKLEKYLSNFRTIMVKLKNRKKRRDDMMQKQTPIQSVHDEQFEMQPIHTDIDKEENEYKNSGNTEEITNGVKS
jgi:hypothetical protein